MKKATTKTEMTVSIDIRSICADRLGIKIQERKLTYPVVGASRDSDCFEITLDSRMSETWKRVILASILAVCLETGERTGCIMTECRDKPLAKRARGLLMPEESFRAEYERLECLGKLRFTALAVLFDVPLDEVMYRAKDLHLA